MLWTKIPLCGTWKHHKQYMNITLTEAAREKIEALVKEGELEKPEIRLVTGCAGCSGLSAGITVDEAPDNSDLTHQTDGITVCIEKDSAQYLDGTTIDYDENEFGGNFVVTNEYGSSVCFI